MAYSFIKSLNSKHLKLSTLAVEYTKYSLFGTKGFNIF